MAGEFDIIQRYFLPLAGPSGLHLQDDVALIKPDANKDIVVSKDMLIAGTHFFAEDNPADIAFKALSVNVSDIVSKGAEPQQYFLGLALPSSISEDWLRHFSVGLREAQDHYKIHLSGGDTTRINGPTTVSVTILGDVSSEKAVLRSGAKAGDNIFISGPVGASAAALQLRLADKPVPDALMKAYLRPEARIDFQGLVQQFASASADVSDGLLADLGHICKASALGAKIELDAIPMLTETSDYIQSAECPPESVWSGGDDYQILFTVPESNLQAMIKFADENTLVPIKVGQITKSKKVEVVDKKGNLVQISHSGYQHFS
jgi:thiamine-monophosphate kinase